MEGVVVYMFPGAKVYVWLSILSKLKKGCHFYNLTPGAKYPNFASDCTCKLFYGLFDSEAFFKTLFDILRISDNFEEDLICSKLMLK